MSNDGAPPVLIRLACESDKHYVFKTTLRLLSKAAHVESWRKRLRIAQVGEWSRRLNDDWDAGHWLIACHPSNQEYIYGYLSVSSEPVIYVRSWARGLGIETLLQEVSRAIQENHVHGSGDVVGPETSQPSVGALREQAGDHVPG